jgi:hypothetical protein
LQLLEAEAGTEKRENTRIWRKNFQSVAGVKRAAGKFDFTARYHRMPYKLRGFVCKFALMMFRPAENEFRRLWKCSK